MNNHTATFCFYRYIPCFLHENEDEIQLIGMDWYFDTILSSMIWLDENIFKPKKLPIKFTDLILNL